MEFLLLNFELSGHPTHDCAFQSKYDSPCLCTHDKASFAKGQHLRRICNKAVKQRPFPAKPTRTGRFPLYIIRYRSPREDIRVPPGAVFAPARPPTTPGIRRGGLYGRPRAGTSPAPTSKRRKTARRKRNPGCRGGKNSFGNCGNFWAFFSSNR